MNQLSILKTQFIDKFQRLDTCQNQISEQLLDTEDAVQEYLDDREDAENYRDRYIEMCTRVDLKKRETVVPTETEKRSFKLPKIELKKFSGEAKDFLAFWIQFQKIHNDKGIAEEDKMQYLLQSVLWARNVYKNLTVLKIFSESQQSLVVCNQELLELCQAMA
ncbi:uncharacterized protein TNCV_632601 [Trichonephila clavipes]|nr:uncharacterized protein TNCV_632601 [Trichonephila clavipes]